MARFGSTILSKEMKEWFYSGTTNAAETRRDEIWGYLDGITWSRKTYATDPDFEDALTWIDTQYVDGPYYWMAQTKSKTWILYPEVLRHEYDHERWTMREHTDYDGFGEWKAGWSLGINPANFYISINLQFYR